MRSKLGVWLSRLLAVIFVLFLCSTGEFGKKVALAFCLLVAFFMITDQLEQRTK